MSEEFNLQALFAKLTEWQNAKAQVAAIADPLVAEEKRLRGELFALAFPAPKEGTNTFVLPEDWQLKGILPITRKVDEAALPAVLAAIRAQGFNPDPAFKYTPEIVVKTYKAMPPEIVKMIDTALTIKPGLPQVNLQPPKAKT